MTRTSEQILNFSLRKGFRLVEPRLDLFEHGLIERLLQQRHDPVDGCVGVVPLLQLKQLLDQGGREALLEGPCGVAPHNRVRGHILHHH